MTNIVTRLTLRIGSEGRQQPVHVRLRQRTGGLDEEVRQESVGIQGIVPVDLPGTRGVEPRLHDDGPDVYAQVENYHCEEADLRPTTLADVLHVEDETKTETADAARSQGVLNRPVVEGSTLTYMQKKGEIRDDRARDRTEK